jgi:RNA polymerase sigma factor (sigma-70 family)
VTALYQAHALGLIRLAVVMLGDRPAAEDVVQEAFCGLYRRWHSLSDTGKALSYVRSSVINGCRSVLRRRLRPADLAGDPPDESAEAMALIDEEHRQVLTAIRSLPARQREALVLRFYLDLDEGEIAAWMSSAGRVSSVSRLRVTVPASQVLNAFALSPDGQRLALAAAPKKGPARTDLEVVTLSTGSTRMWAANGIFRSGAADSRGLSWTADGRELAFEWEPKNQGVEPPVEERLLSLTSADGDLLTASRRVIATTRQYKPSGSTFQVTDTQYDPAVTPDGSVIVTNAVYFQVKTKASGQAWNGRYGFAEYSTGTGKLVRILGYWKVKPAGYWTTQVLWSSPSGRVLIAVIPDGRIGVINGNEFTPLNMPPVSGTIMELALGAQAGAW